MYNFGVVVDDAFMGITHVLRAQAQMRLSTNLGPHFSYVNSFVCRNI